MLFGIIKLLKITHRKRDNYTAMRASNQVILPLNLEISIPKEDFVFKVAEICEELDYTELFQT